MKLLSLNAYYLSIATAAFSNGADRGTLELYLTDREFVEVLGLGPAEFAKLPAWKQAKMKKAAQLF